MSIHSLRGAPAFFLHLVGLLTVGLAGPASAQPLGPIITIPIEKVRETYLNIHEDGRGKACGVKLYGEWTAYRSYTNRSSYRIFTPGLQSTPVPQNSVPVGGRFRFYCYFNGVDGPNLDSPCPTEIGEALPDWYVEVQRRGPSASFTWRALPPEAGRFEFASTSTDPEGELLVEQWDFGDGNSGNGVGPIHRFTQPGNVTVRLTVTDTDALTNATTRTIVVPAPKLNVSLRLFSRHEFNRLEPGEVVRVQATVSASADGVGDLSSVAFTGTPLVLPPNLSLVQAPGSTDIGTLAPGQEKVFEWTLRAGAIGDFTLQTAALTARDAVNRPVSAARATLLGSVTALIVGIQQRPARVVLGEDNNGDGVVNAADARVELVLGVTNVATFPITDLRTEPPGEPIGLVTRLADVPVSLIPVTLFSGDLGTLQPGAANAVFRTNVYTATRYVLATASTLLRGMGSGAPVQGGASTPVKVRNPGVTITMHALEKSGLDPTSLEKGIQDLDAPLLPATDAAVLDVQPEVGSGLVGDGVTPLLFRIEADTKALSVQDEPLKIRLQASIRGLGKLGGASLQDRLRILKNGAWTVSDTVELTRAEPTLYASLIPVASDHIEPPAGQGFLGAELEVVNADSDSELETIDFGLRKPPIALVHGYNTDGSWGDASVAILKQSRPDDARAGSFVRVIRYGQAVDGSALAQRLQNVSRNTTWPLEDLVPMLHEEFRKAMEPLRKEWAFTRHDVVAHSQGGLLTRMLCLSRPNHVMRQAFRNEENFNRGWFHRVVTIGSPHNGTRILRYMLTMDAAGIPFGLYMPRLVSEALVFKRVAQEKFDPWGPQIVNLNNQHAHAPWYPDPGARFHLVRTTVNDGQPPSTLHATVSDFFLGLNIEAFGLRVIPRGSDGVVDFDSMAAAAPGAGPAANVFTLPASYNVSHATTAIGPWDDIFEGTAGGQVNAVAVAEHVIGALDQAGIPDQHRVFGPFRPPPPLSPSIRDEIDRAALAQNNLFNVDDLANLESPGAPSLNRLARPAGDGPHTFLLKLQPSTRRPLGGPGVFWFAELYGTNGVSTDGLRLEPDAANPTQAALHVDAGVLGDVVAYAFYPTAAGGNVYSKPLRVASFEPASPAVELRVLPQGGSLPAGDAAPIQVLVRHEDGMWIQRHAEPDEIRVTSTEPLVVDVENPLEWHCLSAGKSRVSATWRGLSSEGEVTVFGHRDGALPVPRPLVWLKADAGLNRVGAGVQSWTDQSGNGFVFTAPTEARRPAWVSNVVNGLPALRFTTSQLVGNLGRTLTNATIFTLCRFTAGGSASYVYAFGTRDFSGLMMTLARRSGDGAYHYDGAAERVADNAIPGADFRVFSQVFGEEGPDRHRLAVNAGTVLDTRTTTGRAYSAVATNVVLGKYVTSTFYFPGDLVEWLVYDRTLSVEERLEVEEYLRKRAGLAPFFTPGSLDLTTATQLDYNSGELPDAAWELALSRRQARQTAAADPGFLLVPEAPAGSVLQARLGSTGDRGFLGFVVGLKDPGNFLLFDWNRAATNHPAFGLAPAGMRLRSFHLPGGQAPTGADFWSSPDPARVTPIHSAPTPWVPGVTYDLTIRILPDRLELEVRQGTNTVVSWSLPQLPEVGGRLGFYAFAAPGAQLGELSQPGAPLWVSGFEPAGPSEVTLRWMNGQPPYVIEGSTSLRPGEWFDVAPATSNQSQSIPITDDTVFLRVRGAAP